MKDIRERIRVQRRTVWFAVVAACAVAFVGRFRVVSVLRPMPPRMV